MPLDQTNWQAVEVDETTELPAEQSDATRLLIRARGFIERGWCRMAEARDAGGDYVDPTSEHAVAWCAWGALLAAGAPLDWDHPAVKRLDHAVGGGKTIDGFNDRQRTVKPILAAFDRAIAVGG